MSEQINELINIRGNDGNESIKEKKRNKLQN